MFVNFYFKLVDGDPVLLFSKDVVFLLGDQVLSQLVGVLALSIKLLKDFHVLGLKVLSAHFNCKVFILNAAMFDQFGAFAWQEESRTYLAFVVVGVSLHIG